MPEEVVHYLEFIKKLVFELEEQIALSIQTQEDIRMMNMRAQGLMEDCANNLKLHKEKFLQLVLVLDTLSNDLKSMVNQQKKVVLEHALVKAFHILVDEGILKFEQVCKDNEKMNYRLFVTE